MIEERIFELSPIVGVAIFFFFCWGHVLKSNRTIQNFKKVCSEGVHRGYFVVGAILYQLFALRGFENVLVFSIINLK